MSKRAEELALKAYPPIATVPKMVYVKSGILYDPNALKRKEFIKCYEQAEKDTIERAIEWLKYAQDKKMSFDGAIAYFKAIMEKE